MPNSAKQENSGLTAAIYARYSSSAQNDASIEQQVMECQEFAAQHGMTVVTVFEDRAISGRSDNRPGFQRMIRAAERQKFQVLLTYKSNRLARNMLNALAYEDRLDKAGVKVIYCKEDFGNNAAGRLALRMMMSINEFYSENLSEDVRRGMKDSANKRKVVGAIPFGYKKGDDGTFALDEQAAPVVQEIFRRFLNGDSIAELGRELNSRGILTRMKRPWGKNSFHTILSNERYTGVYIHDDIRIEGGMPKIIERDVFEAVQNKLENHTAIRARHRGNKDYMLTGKLFCGYCLAPMVGLSGRGRWGGEYFYYACQNRRIHKTCTKKNVRKEFIEEEITRCILECVLKDETVEWIANTIMEMAKQRNTDSRLAEYERRLAENKKAIANIVRAVELGVVFDEFSARMEQLQEEKKELTSLIAVEKATMTTYRREDIIVFLEAMRNGNPKDKKFQKKIIRDFVRAVYLFDDHFKLSVDFTGENTVYTYPISVPDESASDTISNFVGSLGVCKSTGQVYQKILIQTPGSRNRIDAVGSGFVITWYFNTDH